MSKIHHEGTMLLVDFLEKYRQIWTDEGLWDENTDAYMTARWNWHQKQTKESWHECIRLWKLSPLAHYQLKHAEK